MPTELEELVEFLHHGNTQIRQVACEHLVGYSSNPAIFKTPQLVPITDLKLLVRDYEPIAKNALTILINISGDKEILASLATDDKFIEALLTKITNPKDSLAGDCSTLLSNLSTHDSLSRLLTLKRSPTSIFKSDNALNQLLDCFIYTPSQPAANGTTNGTPANHSLNSDSSDPYAYLSYLFANLTQHTSVQTYFLNPQPYDSVYPISKLLPFTTHSSPIRRRGISSTLKNLSFSVDHHLLLLAPAPDGIHILPHILLPLAGPEQLPLDETEQMLEELQLLPPDKERESDTEILVTLMETLLLLSTTRNGRERLREAGTYFVVRETHLAVEEDAVREVCERLVDVLMRDEAREDDEEVGKIDGVKEVEVEVDEDERIEEVF